MESYHQPVPKGTVVENSGFHPAVQVAAKVISVIFHPLFIPVYISWFLIQLSPLFPAFSAGEKNMLLIRFFVMYTIFPLVTVLLAKGLGFIESIYLRTQKDRIIPYIACGVYYFWMWYVLKNQAQFPVQFIMLSLAIFIASFVGLIGNSFLKVSMHAISLGIMNTFIILVAFSTDVNFGFYIAVALFIGGLVSSARLVNSDHHPFEVYAGWIIGIVSQIAGFIVAT